MPLPFPDKRVFSRKPGRFFAQIVLDDPGPPIPCVAWDLSAGGAKLAAPHHQTLPKRFWLVSTTLRRRCQLSWLDNRFVGVEFIDDEKLFPRRDRRVKDRRSGKPTPASDRRSS